LSSKMLLKREVRSILGFLRKRFSMERDVEKTLDCVKTGEQSLLRRNREKAGQWRCS